MSAAVNDAISGQSMGEIRVSTNVTESELQYRHARNVMAVAQSHNVRRDQTQIFSEEWEPA